MEDLSSHARALIQQSRLLDEPPQTSRARVASRLGLTAGFGAVGTAKAAFAIGKGFSSVLAIGGVSAVATYLTLTMLTHEPPSANVRGPAKQGDIGAAVTPGRGILARPSAASTTTPPVVLVGRPVASVERLPQKAPKTPLRGGDTRSTDDSLAAEVQALRRASTALESGHADHALEILNQPSSGQALIVERSALRILALCAAGRVEEARALQEAYVREYPGSPMRNRVEQACARSW
jgi:hypothetical protein